MGYRGESVENKFLSVSFSAQEVRLLANEPWEWTVLYLYIRMWMNYKTGISGLDARFREDILGNVLFVKSVQGRKGQEKITRKKVRSVLDGLERVGLIKRRLDLGPLVFEHPNALLDKSVQNKRGQKRARIRANESQDNLLIEEENKIENEIKGPELFRTKGPPQNTEYINYKEHNLYAHFDEFWDNYPRQIGGRTRTREFWIRHNFDELAETIIADVRLRKVKHAGWQGDKQFIPYPKTYLSKRLWEDSIEEQQNGRNERSINKSATQRNAEVWNYLAESAGYTGSSETTEQVYSGTVYEDDSNLRLPLEQQDAG